MKTVSFSRLFGVPAFMLSFLILSFIPVHSAASALPETFNFRWQPTYPIYPSPYFRINPSDSPQFRKFVETVADGQKAAIRGIYVDGVLALSIVEQPAGDAAFVSEEQETGTLFSKAVEHGVTGILAHNYLAGERFYDLQAGQEVRVVFGDGRYRMYRIMKSELFQRLSPNDLRSDLIELASGKRMTSGEVFNRFYDGGHHLTFQTCLGREGLSNWGLTFVVAEPILP